MGFWVISDKGTDSLLFHRNLFMQRYIRVKWRTEEDSNPRPLDS